ncbi:hypothetical protein CUT44_30475 [Streptomyces carminius]|uniref:Secreted protein n=1 Tax=Streptomyces carminius TaxID=2665496 RepID=A0A2M8LRE6_9ACTN|nr:hypothetical protein [Streptomyces carminius]PJE94534.1 hypothetical protein CUT44_30475 [Streptomyces carminius]
MGGLLSFLVFAGVLAAVLGCFAWFASRVRRRGLAGGALSAALASYEEAFRVTAHEAHHEIRAQAERRAPVLSPGDDWRRSSGGTGRPGAGTRRRPRPPRRSRRTFARLAGRLGRGR